MLKALTDRDDRTDRFERRNLLGRERATGAEETNVTVRVDFESRFESREPGESTCRADSRKIDSNVSFDGLTIMHERRTNRYLS